MIATLRRQLGQVRDEVSEQNRQLSMARHQMGNQNGDAENRESSGEPLGVRTARPPKSPASAVVPNRGQARQFGRRSAAAERDGSL